MRSYLDPRFILLAAALSTVLASACGKRSGLDRGDASATALENPSPHAQSPGAGDTTSSEGPEFESGRFAAAPGEPAGDATSSRSGETTRIEPSAEPALPRASEPAPAPARRRATSNESSELSARGEAANKTTSRPHDSIRPREERPGLGTTWGETRESPVTSVDFVRDNAFTPTATNRIFYNDTEGVLAQTGQSSLSSLGRNLTELDNGFVTVEIVDPDGDPLPGTRSGSRSYVVGHDGDRYSIRIRNLEPYRIEVLATVDGLDVIDGTKGHFRKRGYVIRPSSSLTIDGFRRSTDSVASFRFGAVSDSYAARTSGDRNVGVIGIALFAERGCCAEPYSRHEIDRRETADPFPGQYARPPRPAQPIIRRREWIE